MAAMSELIEWHRADDVLPDSDETVLLVVGGDAEVWLGYLDGDDWRFADGFKAAEGVLFWATMPEGPIQ